MQFFTTAPTTDDCNTHLALFVDLKRQQHSIPFVRRLGYFPTQVETNTNTAKSFLKQTHQTILALRPSPTRNTGGRIEERLGLRGER